MTRPKIYLHKREKEEKRHVLIESPQPTPSIGPDSSGQNQGEPGTNQFSDLVRQEDNNRM